MPGKTLKKNGKPCKPCKPCKSKKGKSKKLTPWNKFVSKVYAKEKKNGKSFSDCLKIASKLKEEGKMKL
tara:strand:+ start:948 stop:1154 length:207 start_codon:yes stop_codon:yes gene_type:complete